MSLRSKRLAIAIDVARRAYPSGDPNTSRRRLTAFTETYQVLESLNDLPDDWAEECLDAAWDLVRDARTRGTLPENILADLQTAHRAVLAAVDAPPATTRKKPRRDA